MAPPSIQMFYVSQLNVTLYEKSHGKILVDAPRTPSFHFCTPGSVLEVTLGPLLRIEKILHLRKLCTCEAHFG